MAKLSGLPARNITASPIRNDPARAPERNPQGGAGYIRDPKSELFLLAVTNMVSEDTFYEGSNDRDTRYRDLIHAVCAEDANWVARFVLYLRDTMQMRTASVVMAAEYAMAARTDNSIPVRTVVDLALVRPDEPAEFLAYWRHRTGKFPSGGVQRGLAAAAVRLYDEKAALKYNGRSRDMNMADVIAATRPTPRATWQEQLFRHLVEQRRHIITPTADMTVLPMTRKARALQVMSHDQIRELVYRPDAARILSEAGVTWEALSGMYGTKLDARAWEVLIEAGMPYMALLRNLRNFDEAGLPDPVAAEVAARLADAVQVQKSRQFPFRFLSAYRAVPSLRWGHSLERALHLSLANVPELPGRTLVLVDRSVSMFDDKMSKHSDLSRADGAAIFGAALAMRAEAADLVQFGTGSALVPFNRNGALLRVLDTFTNMGGTDTARAVRTHYRGQDRVVIVTDEQPGTFSYSSFGDTAARNPLSYVPAEIPVYSWNLAGYKHGHAPSGSENRHTFGGLTDAAFRMIPLLEARQSQVWPF